MCVNSFLNYLYGVPYQIRTGVVTVKGWCPRPLDERDLFGTRDRNRTYTSRVKVCGATTTLPGNKLVVIVGVEPTLDTV